MSLQSLADPEVFGLDRPRLENAPAAYGTFGPLVIEFAAACGVLLDDWQQYVVNGMFAVNEVGQWVATEFGLLVSRQNGKGEILVAYDLAHLFMFPRKDNRRKTTLHSAHEVKTAIDGFQRLQGVVESQGKLMDRIEHRGGRISGIKIGNGQEGITLDKRKGQLNGDRIRFIARSRNSGRGFAADTNVYDEAQELASRARDALTYTQSTSPNKQEIFTGTVPSEENDAEVFQGVRDRGRSGSGKATGWMEWSPTASENPKAILVHPNVPTLFEEGKTYIDLGSELAMREAVPSLNIRITRETVEEQVERATDVEALARERFSVWPDPAETVEEILNELNLKVWERLGSEIKPDLSSQYRVTNPESIAIALGRGGGYATISIAQRFDADIIITEHKITKRQTLWIPSYVAELKAAHPSALVVLDAKNASAILTGLDSLGIKYMSMNINELTGAQAAFVELVNEGLVGHPAQAEVTKSLKFAIPRAIGTAGFTWEASDPKIPVTHAQTATWSVWGVAKLESAPAKPPAEIRGYA